MTKTQAKLSKKKKKLVKPDRKPRRVVSKEKKRPVGRPSEYDPSYPEKLLKYFSKEPTKIERAKVYNHETGAQDVVEQRVPVELPTLAGFCCMIGIHRGTLWDWAQRYPKLTDALKICKEWQERILVANGLNKGYDKTFAIFTAKNLINWHDKQQLEVSGTVTYTHEQREKKLANLRRELVVSQN